MSYCRMHEGDVYVVASVHEDNDMSYWNCVGCSMGNRRFFGRFEVSEWIVDTRQEMLDHLLKHRAEGHKVPERAL